MKKLFIVGCGNIGRRVLALAGAQGIATLATARSQERRAQCVALGATVVTANLDDPGSLLALPTAGTTVLFTAPPPGGGHTDPRMRNFLAAIAAGDEPEKIVYLSTSGVYGDQGGELVSEDTPPNPQTARAKRRFDAETGVRAWGAKHRVPTVVLRVTGIYGPEFTPLMRLQGDHPVLRPEEAPPTNRIHADDLAQVCLAAAERGEDGDIFNVSDGQPSTMTEYFTVLAELFGFSPPRQVSLAEAQHEMNPTMLSYLSESRRLDNTRLREKLGVTLKYPTLHSALPDLAREVASLLQKLESGATQNKH
ncbi:MAG: SDR family oxidoreductase [Desulfuromonadaceae bacterium]|nr:SDR family oxidoreductase [Desulfuromonadaceae bacterium]